MIQAINNPIGWWGPPGRSSSSLSIISLLELKTLSPDLAALLWLFLQTGTSLIIAAGPQRAGKTTLLTALLSLLPSSITGYYTQGFSESFVALPSRQPNDPPTFILINEISDHLSTYLWGKPVQRVFSLLGNNYSLAATMHANRVEECLWQLHYECSVPAENLARCSLILTMTTEPGRHRVAQLFSIVPEEPILPLAEWDRSNDTYSILDQQEKRERAAKIVELDPKTLFTEIEKRSVFLKSLVRTETKSIEDVTEAIRSFHIKEKSD